MTCLLIGSVLSGCGKKENLLNPADAGRAPAPGASPKTVKAAKPAPRVRPRSGPITQVSEATLGRVLVVNANLRFAVIDFGLRRIPDAGTRLNAFRNDLKVGEIKITEWRQESNAVGDITAGELRAGDEIRPD
jgi:hypothetical protein